MIAVWGLCGDTRRTLGKLLLLDSSEEPGGAERLRFEAEEEVVRSPDAIKFRNAYKYKFS